jgi:hypothetical protein
MRDQYSITILSGSCADRDETSGLENLVERATVNNQILDDRECRAPERLHGDGRSILEMTHEQLACGDMVIRSMSPAVDEQGAGSAYTFTTVMVERHGTAALAASFNSHRIVSLSDKLFIQDVKHLKERSILLDS